MNKLDAAKFLPILKAYSEGKTIQVFLSHRKAWVDNINELSFVLKVDSYRIKPENPVGSCMVSSEGARAAHYAYDRFKDIPVKYKRYLMKGLFNNVS